MEYHFITVVWGDAFVDAYLRVALPLQLSSGNLGAFREEKALYRIFTPSEDRKKICESPVYARLKEMVTVDFVDISTEEGATQYDRMNRCHQMAIRDASRVGAVLVFLSPDCLLSNESFNTLLRAVREGKRIVMVPSMRLKKEEMVPLLEKALAQESVRQEGISSRQLVAMGLPLLHELSQSLFWGEKINERPSHMYWMLDHQNVLVRGFHLHPLLVWPEKKVTTRATVDDYFVTLACPDRKKWKIVEDSDELVIFEISKVLDGKLLRISCTPLHIAWWAAGGAMSHHRFCVQKKLYLKSGDRSSTWLQTEQASDLAVRKIIRLARLGAMIPVGPGMRRRLRLRTRMRRLGYWILYQISRIR